MKPMLYASVLPPWVSKAVIVAILTGLIGGTGAWVGFVNRSLGSVAKNDGVQDIRIANGDKRTDDVVSELKIVNQTLGDIRDRLPPKNYAPRYIYVQARPHSPEPKAQVEVLNGE